MTKRKESVKIGRPVRITSIGFRDKPLEKIADVVDAEAAKGTDLIALPETWRGQTDNTMEDLQGPTTTAMAALAAKHKTYIISSIDRRDGKSRVNTAVLIGRDGRVAGCYDKVYPYWSEFDHKQPVEPGLEVPVFQTDFGCLGITICFDANFPEVWQRLADQGAELVIFSSGYAAGMSLQAHAINHHYYVVSSTQECNCFVFDITGERIVDDTSKDINITRVTLDLDRGIYHQNFNLEKKDKLLAEHGDDVMQDKWLGHEQWFVLKAKRPGVSARGLAKKYGMEELRDYIHRSRREIDKMRGWPFAEHVVKNRISNKH